MYPAEACPNYSPQNPAAAYPNYSPQKQDVNTTSNVSTNQINVSMASASPTVVIHEQRPRWSWCNLVWSMIATLCCGSVCGCIGLIMSILAYADHKSGDYDRSRSKRCISWAFTITGIVLTVISVITVMAMFFAGFSFLLNYIPFIWL